MNRTPGTLYCFTPLVTLSTFVLEFVLGLLVLYRHRSTKFGRVAALGLFGLASFQLAEWMVCGAGSNMPDFWMRFGFIGTAILPAVGLNLVHLISDKKYKYLTVLGYVFGGVVSLMLLFQAGADLYYACMGKFVAFELSTTTDKTYVLYYTLVLGIAIFLLLGNIVRKHQHVRLSAIMLATLLVFIVPTYALYFLTIISGSSVPSIMCGFAIFAAVLLVSKLIPLYEKEHSTLVSREKA